MPRSGNQPKPRSSPFELRLRTRHAAAPHVPAGPGPAAAALDVPLAIRHSSARQGARARPTPLWFALCAVALAWPAKPALAHDTWLLPLQPVPGQTATRLALGTGELFPLQTTPLLPAGLAHQGCSVPTRATAVPMRALRLPMGSAAQTWQAAPDATHCWAQSVVFEVGLSADKAAAYLDEARASPALREHWARQQAAGQTWLEQYSKHARVLLPRPGAAPDASVQPHTAAQSGLAKAAPLALDIRLHNTRPLQRQQALQAEVLRDGQPLAGLAVELRHDQSRFSQWQVSDAVGRVSLTPPLAGTWVLRAIDLHAPANDQAPWRSRFVTLVFDVAP